MDVQVFRFEGLGLEFFVFLGAAAEVPKHPIPRETWSRIHRTRACEGECVIGVPGKPGVGLLG